MNNFGFINDLKFQTSITETTEIQYYRYLVGKQDSCLVTEKTKTSSYLVTETIKNLKYLVTEKGRKIYDF